MSRYNINFNVDESEILPNLLGTEDFSGERIRDATTVLIPIFNILQNTLEMSS